jgi:hypothetical protein
MLGFWIQLVIVILVSTISAKSASFQNLTSSQTTIINSFPKFRRVSYDDPKTVDLKVGEIRVPFFDDEYINIIEKRSISSLFHHLPLPPNTRSDILSKIHDVSLVISHCDHPLSWVRNITKGYENLISKVWVFTKCGKEVIDAPLNAEIIVLPNVGRCDHTYAHWLSGSYLLNHEMNPIGSPYAIIVFMKDTDYMFNTQNDDGQEFGDLISLAVANGLGCKRVDINLHYYETLRLLEYYGGYTRKGGGNFGEEVPFHNDTFPNLGKWADYIQIHPTAITQNIVPVCCGGVWAVTSRQIAKHPKELWRAIAESLSRGDNIVEGHYAERLWAPLLSKPLSEESANAVWGMNPIVSREPFFLLGMLTLP